MIIVADMNRLDTHPQTTPFTVTTHITGPHLIVLIPNTDLDHSIETRRIWELAHANGMHILFLSLCRDAMQELALRRQFVALAALVSDGRVHAEAKVEIGTSWVDAVRNHYQAGDMVVCHAGQRAGFLHRPLSQILESNLKLPIYILNDSDQQQFRSNWRSEVLGWTGSIGIIAIFSILQVRIVRLPDDWIQSALFILSILPEFWLLRAWNNLFR